MKEDKYNKEIDSTGKSIEYFTKFKDNFGLSINTTISNEELFVGYYRAMQLWLFKDKEVERKILQSAIDLGKVRTIKIIQKVIEVKPDGVFGPVSRANLQFFSLKEFSNETSKFKYQLIKLFKS